MSTTTEREIKVADGLGNADASQVLYGATFSSEDGFNIEGTFVPDASNITYNDTTVEVALDELVESTNNLPSAGTKLIETLPANETTVTFTSDEITENTTLNAVYTSIFGVQLESANVENGVLTLTFEAQEEDMTVVALINATMSDSDETNLGDIDADEVKVDDTNLGLGVTNVQGALEKLKETVDNVASNGSSSGVLPLNVVNPSISTGNTTLTVSWEDPEDTTIDGTVMAEWQGTKLVYKLGAYPTSVTDGVLAIDNQIKDQYKDNGFTISGLTNGETYYIALFPYSTDGVVNDNEENRLSGTPVPYRTMTIKIDQTDSNPETCCTYADNAVGMTVGSDEWDEFFGHYPCLFKDGVEIGRLNPNNFAQFEDGTTADITSGNAGDVMIAFPRLGVKISTDSNDVVTISMTDNPNDENFTYYAHTRGTTNKDVFYLGAYKGYNSSNKLRSLSGKTPTASTTIGNFRTYAQANGTGYEQSGFYQLVFRQCMYLLKYKNLDSQTAVGRGYVDGNSASIATGNTNAKGMDWGETTGKYQMKLFGLEDFWGNVYEFIDGIYSDASRNICTATDGFNDTGSGYTNQGSSGFASDTYGYMTKVQGTSEMGFVLKAIGGSETTHCCDYANVYASRLAFFGGSWNNASSAGAFRLSVNLSASDSDSSLSARLMFL